MYTIDSDCDYSKEGNAKLLYMNFSHVGYMCRVRNINAAKAEFITDRYEELGIRKLINDA